MLTIPGLDWIRKGKSRFAVTFSPLVASFKFSARTTTSFSFLGDTACTRTTSSDSWRSGFSVVVVVGMVDVVVLDVVVISITSSLARVMLVGSTSFSFSGATLFLSVVLVLLLEDSVVVVGVVVLLVLVRGVHLVILFRATLPRCPSTRRIFEHKSTIVTRLSRPRILSVFQNVTFQVTMIIKAFT